MNASIKNVESDDAICLAYGRGVKELLGQSTASEWIEDLWIIYSDHMAFQKESGCNPRIGEILLSFRDLVFFFQKLEERAARVGSREERGFVKLLRTYGTSESGCDLAFYQCCVPKGTCLLIEKHQPARGLFALR